MCAYEKPQNPRAKQMQMLQPAITKESLKKKDREGLELLEYVHFQICSLILDN